MARLKEMAAYLGLASRPKRYVKAFFACLGIFFLFSIFIYFAGLLDGGGSLTTRNGVRVAFILAVIWTWLTVMKGERKVLADFVPGLRSQAHRERKAVEKTRVNKEWELQQLSSALPSCRTPSQLCVTAVNVWPHSSPRSTKSFAVRGAGCEGASILTFARIVPKTSTG
jgi:hypothetical protein